MKDICRLAARRGSRVSLPQKLDFLIEFSFLNWFYEIVQQEYGGESKCLVEKLVL